jgi:hypothetical protein
MDENSSSNVKQEVFKILDQADVGMFSSRDNTDDAFEYAMQIAQAQGMPKGLMATALMVYHNTLIKVIKEAVNGL